MAEPPPPGSGNRNFPQQSFDPNPLGLLRRASRVGRGHIRRTIFGDSQMKHALIIDGNRLVGRAIQHYLEPLGFHSFDHSWTRRQAFEAASRRTPDIIVIGDDAAGAALEAAKAISADAAVPVLMVSGDREHAARQIAQAATFAGPFRLDQIDEALAIALARAPSGASEGACS